MRTTTRTITTTIALALAVAAPAAAQAPQPTPLELSAGQVPEEVWASAPLYDGPGWADSLGPALDYWSQVPEVSFVDARGQVQVLRPAERVAELRGPAEQRSFCQGGLTYHIIDTGLAANAWGRTTHGEDRRCRIWIERAFAELTESFGPGERERVRCAAGVHEVGHVLGLPHGNFPDPLNILGDWPHQLYPVPCLLRWPVQGQAPGTPPESVAPAPEPARAASVLGVDPDDYVTLTKWQARKAVRARLGGRGWRLRSEVSMTEDGWPMEVTVAATRKRCVRRRGGGRKCRTVKRRFYVMMRADGRPRVTRTNW